ncbi:hypothetical protein SUGI_0664850 [Cryptomeria japonica]|nr:hypothetical protein SUGI_0664850 [Cryptomeria japonica]
MAFVGGGKGSEGRVYGEGNVVVSDKDDDGDDLVAAKSPINGSNLGGLHCPLLIMVIDFVFVLGSAFGLGVSSYALVVVVGRMLLPIVFGGEGFEFSSVENLIESISRYRGLIEIISRYRGQSISQGISLSSDAVVGLRAGTVKGFLGRGSTSTTIHNFRSRRIYRAHNN